MVLEVNSSPGGKSPRELGSDVGTDFLRAGNGVCLLDRNSESVLGEASGGFCLRTVYGMG